MTIKVLHISESFEGGVASATANYVRATPEIEHHLLAYTRAGQLDPEVLRLFKNTTLWETSPLRRPIKALGKIRQAAQGFDSVHAHSSFGGALVRAAYYFANRSTRPRIIYTPHCYAFERGDISFITRGLFWLGEKLFAKTTDAYAACSPREANLSRSINSRADVVYIPNISNLKSAPSQPRAVRKLVTIGRVVAQKNPELFDEIVSSLDAAGDGFEHSWVGTSIPDSGFGELAHRLNTTGWLSQADLRKELQSADLYLHTARWEGLPIAILDAHQLGLPILAKREPWLEGFDLPDSVLFGSADEAADKIRALSPETAQQNFNLWEAALADCRLDILAERLRAIYENRALLK